MFRRLVVLLGMAGVVGVVGVILREVAPDVLRYLKIREM